LLNSIMRIAVFLLSEKAAGNTSRHLEAKTIKNP